MTATTISPPDVELESWASAEIEAVCEMQGADLAPHKVNPTPCRNPAKWRIVFWSECPDVVHSLLICDRHKGMFVAAANELMCADCSRPVRIRWIDRFRVKEPT